MHKLANRFTYLRNMELAAAVIVPILFVWDWGKKPDAVNWPLGIAALVCLSYLLVQGAIYWHLKLAALAGSIRLPGYFGGLFASFRLSSLILLCAVGLAFCVEIGSSGWNRQLAWPLGLYLFAILEHINYYHYQLMYDTGNAWRYLAQNRRLRKAALGLDLQRART